MLQYIKEWFMVQRTKWLPSRYPAPALTLKEQEEEIRQKCRALNVDDFYVDLETDQKDWALIRTERAQYYFLSQCLQHKDLTRLLLRTETMLRYKEYLLAHAPYLYSGLYGSLFQALDAKKDASYYTGPHILNAYEIPVDFWQKEYEGKDVATLNNYVSALDFTSLSSLVTPLIQQPGIVIASLMISGHGLLAASALLYPDAWHPEHFRAYQTIGQRFSSEGRLSWLNFIVGRLAKEKGVPWHLESEQFEVDGTYYVSHILMYVLANADRTTLSWSILDDFFAQYLSKALIMPNVFISEMGSVLFNEPRYTELLYQYKDFFANKANYPKNNKVLDLIYRLPESHTWFPSSVIEKSQWTLSKEELCKLCDREPLYLKNLKVREYLKIEVEKAESMGISVWDVIQLERDMPSDIIMPIEVDLHLG